MVHFILGLIGALLLFGAFSTTKYIIDHDEEETETTTSATTTSTTPTTTSTTLTTTSTTPTTTITTPTTTSTTPTTTSTTPTTTNTINYTITKKVTTRFTGLTSSITKGTRSLRFTRPTTPAYTRPSYPDEFAVAEYSLEDVFFSFFNGMTIDDFVDIPFYDSERLLRLPRFKKVYPTMVYITGYLDNENEECIRFLVLQYYRAQINTNIIIFNWTNKIAHGNYLKIAAPNAKKVGEAAAEQFNNLFKAGLPLENLHFVGFSLGSHVAGYIGRVLKNKYKKTLKRITGLDPVYHGFYPGCEGYQHISAEDAEFVDIVHTDAGGFGAPYRTGTADFWPNGGERIQPGCPQEYYNYGASKLTSKRNLCSHWRSCSLYAESVSNPVAFPASPAFNYSEFKRNHRPKYGMVYMGYKCDTKAYGSYYFTTRSRSPFSYGMHGIYSS